MNYGINLPLKEKQKILITTGIYPPKIGGPAQYAKNLKEAFEKRGYSIKIETYNLEYKMPTGIRHLYFFFKILPNVIWSDVIFSLDTFSVGLPTVLASKIFSKKCIIRTGGDFLWEQYVERTKRKALLRNFYNTEKENFTIKEKIIFALTKWTLTNVSHIIFSTDWQRQIFIKVYDLNVQKTSIVENYYGPKQSDNNFESKVFVASARNLAWKNFDILEKVFKKVEEKNNEVFLFTKNLPYQEFINKMKNAYAVILVSLGDISPNMILDAIKLNRPFICTKEVGIYERIKEAGVFVDPLDEKEIEEAVLNLLTGEGYKKVKEKVQNFNFVHTWDEIAEEFLITSNNLKK